LGEKKFDKGSKRGASGHWVGKRGKKRHLLKTEGGESKKEGETGGTSRKKKKPNYSQKPDSGTPSRAEENNGNLDWQMSRSCKEKNKDGKRT